MENLKIFTKYNGCPYLYVRLLRSSDIDSLGRSLSYNNVKLTKLSQKNRKEYLSDNICKKAFEKFDAIYKNEYFMDNLNKNKKYNYQSKVLNEKYREIQDNLYAKRVSKEEKEKLRERMEVLSLKRRDIETQEMNDRGISHFKEYKDFFKYLKDTKSIIEKMYPEWFDVFPEEHTDVYEEEFVEFYDENGDPQISKTMGSLYL